jgi:hypothetical protein
MDNGQPPVQHMQTFIGEVSEPLCSLEIMKGFVEFYVRTIKGGNVVPGMVAELLDQDGHSHTVTIRAVGRITPTLAGNKWRPGDFLVCIGGISMDEAIHMRQLRQVHNTETEKPC